ncbi:MAG: glycoside hydrolase family 27 protein [Steroidobacteraceae bacterium]
MHRYLWIALLFTLLRAPSALALDNGLARTPPMGWNSWNKFGCNVSEQLIREMTDAAVSSGMQAAGYRYIIIDDCWQVARDASGNIQADPQRFPSGMKALADYIHARGLKFGLYSDAGERTCQQRPGSKGHEEQDAKQYAAWGVDYLKYDWCNTAGQSQQEAYATMSRALAQSGRDIVFSICEWGSSRPWTWAASVGHLWRTTGDIKDCWDCKGGRMGPPPGGAGAPPAGAAGGAGGPGPGTGAVPAGGPPPVAMGLGFLQIIDQQVELARYAGPGHWNDPDMLEVGNGGMSTSEYRAHFSLWAMMAAPLMAGNDLRSMDAATRAILTNREVIAVDQDALGRQGTRLRRQDDLDIWVKPLSDGGWAVTLLNRGKGELQAQVSWKELGLSASSRLQVRDLWRARDLGVFASAYATRVPAHDVVMIRVKR